MSDKEILSPEKKLNRKKEFIRWAMTTPGVYNYPESVLLEEMEDTDTYMGAAWQAWKAAWKVKSRRLSTKKASGFSPETLVMLEDAEREDYFGE